MDMIGISTNTLHYKFNLLIMVHAHNMPKTLISYLCMTFKNILKSLILTTIICLCTMYFIGYNIDNIIVSVFISILMTYIVLKIRFKLKSIISYI